MTTEETVAVPKGQMVAMLASLDAANREMNGTARLLGTQHAAIEMMSEAFRQIIRAEDGDARAMRTITKYALYNWGTKEEGM